MHVVACLSAHSSEGEVLEALVEEEWKTMMMNTLKEEVERIGNW